MARGSLKLDICTKVGVGGMQANWRHGGTERDLKGEDRVRKGPRYIVPHSLTQERSLPFFKILDSSLMTHPETLSTH